MHLLLPTVLLVLTGLDQIRGQATCKADGDCKGDDNCCSSFGFCGMGEGFCTPSTRVDSGRGSTSGSGVRRSGAGCVLEDTELVGGDIPAILGGGGIKLDNSRNTADECFKRCEDNPACQWYTWDNREELCYLKSGRGYPRNRTDDFTSGATFRDGCNRDPYCDAPYSVYRHQCLFFSQQGGLGQQWSPSLADVRRNLNHSKELCEEMGGFLPYSYGGFSDSLSAGLGPGGSRIGDDWTWTGYGSSGGQCYACRPSRWAEGVRAFPCSQPLAFSCERRHAFPLPAPARPRLYAGAAGGAGGAGGLARRAGAAGGLPRRRRLRYSRGGGLRRGLLARRMALEARTYGSNPFLYV